MSDFEDRFRKLAPQNIEPWYEVLYWKFYSDPGRRTRHVQRAAKRVEELGVDAKKIWRYCEEVCSQFDRDERAAKKALEMLAQCFFSTNVIAAAWTFVAFSDLDRFP